MDVTIEVNNKDDEKLLRQLVKRLGLKIKSSSNKMSRKTKSSSAAYAVLKEMSLTVQESSFGDALEWQKNSRFDNLLPGRE
jgi:hypothetical protein